MNDLIERLRARLSAEKAVRETGHNAADREHAELIRLLTKAADALEAAREDAERYRWLRDEARTNRAPHIFQYPAQSFDHPQYPHFKDVGLDAAIDAAREARNG